MWSPQFRPGAYVNARLRLCGIDNRDDNADDQSGSGSRDRKERRKHAHMSKGNLRWP
jgi:hypothetical protein